MIRPNSTSKDRRDDPGQRARNEQQEPPATAARRARGAQTFGLLLELTDALGELALLPQQFGVPITYDDVIGWFVDKRPAGDVARRGAVLRTRRRAGRVEIVQVFLDGNGEPLRTVSGEFVARRIVGPGLDRELREAFGDQDLVIVQ
jgi:hypothetical protein